MRIYKPTYSKPLPEGAKILRRKDGRYAKYRDKKGRLQEARLTKSGDRILCETTHWHISFEDNLGITRELKAFTNETASNKLADRVNELLCCQANNQQPSIELQKWVEQVPGRIRDKLAELGLLDAKRIAAGRPLTELAVEFEQFLSSKERNPRHIRETITMLKRVLDGCGFRYWSEMSATKVAAYLKELRDKYRISYRRSNGYLQAIQHFSRWMVECGCASESPLRHLKPLNEELDRRHKRRALTADEQRRLLEATLNGPARFGMSGCERYWLYRVALETGLRANELRTLTVGSFDFDNLVVVVEAGYSKHRHQDRQPLQPNLVSELKDFLKGKMPTVRVFGGNNGQLTKNTADMLKADLADAGIPYRDGSGRVCDFHSLRHAFITGLRNASSRVAQKLARHQSSAMTDRYTHIELHDERAALDGLPDLSLPSREKQQAKATGTDDKPVAAISKILSKSCFSNAPQQTCADNCGKGSLDKTRETQLHTANEGYRQNPAPFWIS